MLMFNPTILGGVLPKLNWSMLMPILHPALLSPGARIKWIRQEQGMSQRQLAKELDISQAALSQIERGRSKSPAASTLLRIAAVLDANPEWIMHGRGAPHLSEVSTNGSEISQLFARLAPDQQVAILATIKALI